MTPKPLIKRFDIPDRIFHLLLMVTFLVQAATGLSRMYVATTWGRKLGTIFGGYETATTLHRWFGVAMMIVFIAHTLRLLLGIDWRNWKNSLFGPDSLLPTHHDLIHFGGRVRWLLGMGPPPRLGRWTYWEKFDYWAVYWGLPLLALTGLMLMYPLETSRWLPGWMLNIAALLHRAEAILAVTYIFIVHFFIGHLRPSSFPMNEAMFSGSVSLAEAREEKPAWIEGLEQSGRLARAAANPPSTWYRIVYFIFGYTALGFGVYLLVNAIAYSRMISLH